MRAGRRRWRIAAAILGVAYLASGFYFVGTEEQGLVSVLGAIRERPSEPGLHWTWPWPVAGVVKLKVHETKRLTVGYEMPERVLERQTDVATTQFLTGDRNILDIRIVVQYMIREPAAYLVRATDIKGLIASTAESALTRVVVERRVDDVLTTGKLAVQTDVQARCQEALDRYGCGVSVLGVNIESISPPPEVVEAFRDVASAREDRNRITRQAQSYANETVAIARGVKQIKRSIQVFTLSVSGSTSHRLLNRTDLFDGNIRIGADLTEVFNYYLAS